MIKISERDWKIISTNKTKYLNKLCERFNDQVSGHLLNSTDNAHKKYIKCWEILKENDEFIVAIFNEWKRSRFYNILSGLIKLELIGNDIVKLSDETKTIMIDTYGINKDIFNCPF